jgi:hypothetical protein
LARDVDFICAPLIPSPGPPDHTLEIPHSAKLIASGTSTTSANDSPMRISRPIFASWCVQRTALRATNPAVPTIPRIRGNVAKTNLRATVRGWCGKLKKVENACKVPNTPAQSADNRELEFDRGLTGDNCLGQDSPFFRGFFAT